MLRFNRRGMSDYFGSRSEFDYIKYKYSHLLEGLDKQTASIFYKGFVQYERTKPRNLYEKIDYNQIKDRIKLIYNDSDDTDSFIFFYDFALSELIDGYLNIPLLDRIFSHHYFEYEWEQHVDMNFEKNELSFYRDHFIHQIRNCYMIMRYLDENDGNYYRKIEETLKERTTSISKYACAQVEQYEAVVKSKISSNFTKYKKELSQGNNPEKDGEEDPAIEKVDVNIESFAWNYLIRGSLIVAALFHDIGYPIRYIYKSISSVSNYLSMVMPSDNIGFDKLNDLLEGSILFVTTGKKELRARYESLDHGALSAFILLLQFYENGAIYSLNPIKRAIIELAAVVIYDHTLKYESMGDDKNKYKDEIREKPSFKDNPLTYTLRFVDDIQEWDRMYFEIKGNSEFRYCEKCKMPIRRLRMNSQMRDAFEKIQARDLSDMAKKLKDPQTDGADIDSHKFEQNFSFDYVVSPAQNKIYICGCEDGYKIPFPDSLYKFAFYSDPSVTRLALRKRIRSYHFSSGKIESGSHFRYQSINYTMTCDEVVLLKKNGTDIFYINYNSYSQLYMLILSNTALRNRIKEIAKLNKQFENQYDINICMRTHITDNPVMLKLRILCEFVYEVGFYIKVSQHKSNDDNSYKRNASYYKMLADYMDWTKRTNFSKIYTFVKKLETKGIFLYGYDDEGVKRTELVDTDKKRTIDYKMIKDLLHNAVRFLMSDQPTKKSGANTFINNLENTVDCYMDILEDFLKHPSNKADDFVKKEIESGADFSYIDEVHIRASKTIFRDFISQLYYQEKGDMNWYYNLREGDEDEDKAWTESTFVVKADDMGQALDVFFKEKYYNPLIMSTVENVNKDKFTFLDVNSDMYLFKEMARFVADNKKRRLERDEV